MHLLLRHLNINIYFLIISIPITHTISDSPYYECASNIYSCGTIGISYPLWGDPVPKFCGRPGFEITCQNSISPIILINNNEFRVLEISSTEMGITRADMWYKPCPDKFINTTLDYTLFGYMSNTAKLTLFYDCSIPTGLSPEQKNFSCPINGIQRPAFYAEDENVDNFNTLLRECGVNIRVPVRLDLANDLKVGILSLQEVLNRGFYVDFEQDNSLCLTCQSSGGICGSSNSSSLEFRCFCRGGSVHKSVCLASGWHKLEVKVVAGIVAVVILFMAITLVYYSQQNLQFKSMIFLKNISKDDKNIEEFVRNFGHGPLASKRYSFSQIKNMTNSFKDKLGQGGFGDVFKGKLKDGSFVAIKILHASKGNGKDFLNEVATISRTSHVNIVPFLGFCFEGNKRALVYEFMPNGSLEKFIHSENLRKNGSALGWKKLYEIAIGIARGLEYLHRGCSARILHFDIKPHNILLDEEFCPKIADFGLAKLCLKKESIISTMDARGTIGYVAPEIFSRNYGGVSHKSEVYSYGMMLLEMVGGRKNIEIQDDHTSEIYFPEWVYKRLEQNDLRLKGIVNEDENKVTRKMALTGLWCIQNHPSSRPSITKVIEMLEGDTKDLQIPPKPFFSSPPRSASISSISNP